MEYHNSEHVSREASAAAKRIVDSDDFHLSPFPFFLLTPGNSRHRAEIP